MNLASRISNLDKNSEKYKSAIHFTETRTDTGVMMYPALWCTRPVKGYMKGLTLGQFLGWLLACLETLEAAEQDSHATLVKAEFIAWSSLIH